MPDTKWGACPPGTPCSHAHPHPHRLTSISPPPTHVLPRWGWGGSLRARLSTQGWAEGQPEWKLLPSVLQRHWASQSIRMRSLARDPEATQPNHCQMLSALVLPIRELKPGEGSTLLRLSDCRARTGSDPLLTRASTSDQGLARCRCCAWGGKVPWGAQGKRLAKTRPGGLMWRVLGDTWASTLHSPRTPWWGLGSLF